MAFSLGRRVDTITAAVSVFNPGRTRDRRWARLEVRGLVWGVLRNEIMDENWPLFAARFSHRTPTENETRLLEASRRLWPAALRAATNEVSETPGLPFDPKTLQPNVGKRLSCPRWGRWILGAVHISDLDSYLFAIFGYRLNRYLARERKRRQIIEAVRRSNATDTSWVERIESGIALQEALTMADESFRAMAWCYCHDFSWEEIGTLFEATKEQARKRFEYGIQKLRKLLRQPAQEKSEPARLLGRDTYLAV